MDQNNSFQNQSSPQNATQTSDENQCTICLSSITDKSSTDTCGHEFCLECLKQWSERNDCCPKCPMSYANIKYNMRSDTDYELLAVNNDKQILIEDIFGEDFDESLNIGSITGVDNESISKSLEDVIKGFSSEDNFYKDLMNSCMSGLTAETVDLTEEDNQSPPQLTGQQISGENTSRCDEECLIVFDSSNTCDAVARETAIVVNHEVNENQSNLETDSGNNASKY